jgi:hypothetical protein
VGLTDIFSAPEPENHAGAQPFYGFHSLEAPSGNGNQCERQLSIKADMEGTDFITFYWIFSVTVM